MKSKEQTGKATKGVDNEDRLPECDTIGREAMEDIKILFFPLTHDAQFAHLVRKAVGSKRIEKDEWEEYVANAEWGLWHEVGTIESIVTDVAHLCAICVLSKQYELVEQMYTDTLRLVGAVSPDYTGLCGLHTAMGTVSALKKDWAAAEHYFNKALLVAPPTDSTESHLPQIMYFLALVYYHWEKYQEAVDVIHEAEHICKTEGVAFENPENVGALKTALARINIPPSDSRSLKKAVKSKKNGRRRKKKGAKIAGKSATPSE